MKLVITMSRRYGTGTSVIAHELSEKLGIPVYDKVNVEETLCEKVYASEVEVIQELAKKPCIILGRCAAEILQGKKNVFNIYICADKEDRVKRIAEKEVLTYEEALKRVEDTDAERAAYYYEHTGKTWGDVNNYHMILNTTDLGMENCTDIVMRYFEQMEYI